MANYFGRKLPRDKPIRLFYSKAERCRDTAREIFNGVRDFGGEAILKEELVPLYRIGINLEFFYEENKKYDILEIFFRWVAGLYSPELWLPLGSYCQKAAEIIMGNFKNIPDNGLDIHITHDLHLMALKFGWFGLPPTKKWVNYLGGFAFSFINDEILLLDSKNMIHIEIPYWWKQD